MDGGSNWFCQVFVCLTRLHRLWGLPSVAGYPTIASLADATGANLTPLVQHSLDRLDHLPSQGFTLGQKQPHTQHQLGRLFQAKSPHTAIDQASSTDD